MPRVCKVCGSDINRSRSRSPFCCEACHVYYVISITHKEHQRNCALCNCKYTMLGYKFICGDCEAKLIALGAMLPAGSIPEEVEVTEEWLHQMEDYLAEQKSDTKLVPAFEGHSKYDGKKEKDAKTWHKYNTVLNARAKTNYEVTPEELEETRRERETAKFNRDTRKGLTPLEIKELEYKAEHYNEDMPQSNEDVLVECYICPAYNWGLSKYFNNDHLEDISMKDLIMWKRTFIAKGVWKRTFNCIAAPADLGKYNCLKCEIGDTKWIPRYDDNRGHYMETAKEFIKSFETFCASLPPAENL